MGFRAVSWVKGSEFRLNLGSRKELLSWVGLHNQVRNQGESKARRRQTRVTSTSSKSVITGWGT